MIEANNYSQSLIYLLFPVRTGMQEFLKSVNEITTMVRYRIRKEVLLGVTLFGLLSLTIDFKVKHLDTKEFSNADVSIVTMRITDVVRANRESHN
mmetsp:Transcript_9729/g.14512  ORF Transcript_9729/g.14512 Transcript_9729/m.14512 type:complete len:95 (+) Transcript_9729:1943-2227(+)